MKLYHTGFYILEKPDIHYGKKNADFGWGFYLSDDEDFSHRWAKQRAGQVTYVNYYELDLKGLAVKQFSRDDEWFHYIFCNRRGEEDSLKEYDVLLGPIANDTIYDVAGITTSGFLKEEDAIKLLQIGPIYKQIVIKTQRAADRLTWIKVEEIDKEKIKGYRALVHAEEEEYQSVFAKAMENYLSSASET